MDGHFKLLRANEEILRLNVEIRRFATFIRDETLYLQAMEQQYHDQPALAFQIRMKRLEMDRYNAAHMKTINQITELKGYTGDGLYGTRNPIDIPFPAEPPVTQQGPLVPIEKMLVDEEFDGDENFEEEQTAEDQDEVVMGAFFSVMELSYDDGAT
jgi:hypothetical protein